MLGNWRAGMLAVGLFCGLGGAGAASGETVADIQAELNLLNGQVEQLRNELVKTGSARGLPTAPATALTRLDQLEAELRRLTNRVDVLSNDVSRIVQDATNRVGDIEFRLTEMEGGDTALLGQPEALGGGVTPPATPPISALPGAEPATGGAQLTVTERSDFDAAIAAAEGGDHARAAELFDLFLTTYPGGPLSADAQYRRGEALAAQADWRGAARSFLDAFSGAPEGPIAPKALYRLGVSLGQFGQVEEACLTLVEVESRYPGADVLGEVAAQKQTLRCP